MGLFKRLAGLLGFARDEEQHHHDDAAASDAAVPPFASAQHLPRRGFSVPVQVPVERSPPPPLLVFCPAGDGGIQGLRWYAKRLRIDEDGDIADEFLDEVPQDGIEEKHEKPLPRFEVKHEKPLPRFEVKYSTVPAKVKNLALLPDGKIQHLVDSEGKLE